MNESTPTVASPEATSIRCRCGTFLGERLRLFDGKLFVQLLVYRRSRTGRPIFRQRLHLDTAPTVLVSGAQIVCPACFDFVTVHAQDWNQPHESPDDRLAKAATVRLPS